MQDISKQMSFRTLGTVLACLWLTMALLPALVMTLLTGFNEIEFRSAAMKEGIIQSFSMSAAEFQNRKAGKDEITFDGILYDIAEVKIVKDSVYLLAYSDHKESTSLNKYLSSAQNNSEFLSGLFKFLILVKDRVLWTESIEPYRFVDLHFNESVPDLNSPVCLPEIPPPENCG